MGAIYPAAVDRKLGSGVQAFGLILRVDSFRDQYHSSPLRLPFRRRSASRAQVFDGDERVSIGLDRLLFVPLPLLVALTPSQPSITPHNSTLRLGEERHVRETDSVAVCTLPPLLQPAPIYSFFHPILLVARRSRMSSRQT